MKMEACTLYICALADVVSALEQAGYSRLEIHEALDEISLAVLLGYRPSAEEVMRVMVRS